MRDSIIANFGMNNSKFTKGMNENNSRLDRFDKNLGGIRAGIAGIVSGFAAGGIKAFVDELDEIGKSAGKIGVATDEIQILRFAAEQTGGSANKLDVAMEKLNNSIGEARQGTGAGVKAFEQLDISLVDTEGLARSNIDIFRDFADGLDAIEDPATKAALVNDVMGRSAGFLINTMRGGSGAIDDYKKQLEEVGGIIDNAAIRRAEEFNDRLNILSKSSKGLGSKAFVWTFDIVQKIRPDHSSELSKAVEAAEAKRQGMPVDGPAGKDTNAEAKAQAEADADARAKKAESDRVAHGIAELNREIKARKKATEERIKLEEKLAAASERLNKDIAKFVYEQMTLEEKQIYLAKELNRVREEAASATGAELIQVKMDALNLTKDLLQVEERVLDEVDRQRKLRDEAHQDLINALAEQNAERAALAEQAEAEADEAERKAKAEADSLEALQGQAIVRAAGAEGGRETGQAKRVVELRDKAQKQEDEGRFDKAARTTARADKIETKLTDRRKDRLFDKARDARESGDTDTLQRLRGQAERQGFISPESGGLENKGEHGLVEEPESPLNRGLNAESRVDSDNRVVGEEQNKEGASEYESAMLELTQLQSERIEAISENIDALRDSFDNA